MGISLTSLVSAALGRGHIAVDVDSGESLDVRGFSVIERISSLFTVTVEVVSANPAIALDTLVGRPASFVIHGAHERVWSGLCADLEQIRTEETGLSTYQLVIVPHLWLATQRRDYRIFQHRSAPEIAQAVLRAWGIDPGVRLVGEYKRLDYRVQYGESDYAFLCRMLEDAGISFWFAHKDGESKLVLADAPERGEPRMQSLPFRDDVSMETGVFATKVRMRRKVRPGKYTLRDRDHRLPAEHALAASAKVGDAASVEAELERYHYVPGVFLAESARGEGTPVADDRGKYRSNETSAAEIAKKRLEAQRADAEACSFETNAHDVAAGGIVHISGHPQPALRRGLLVVAVELRGTHDGEWTQACEAHGIDAPYRPPLVTPKPKTNGVESATVVGPRGEEIHCDELGRVRVHFHWDRQSRMDEKSSCWIPVSQAWGGAGYGLMNVPRVGQEVIVDFLGGDPDRPVIVGRVHTATQPVPQRLPENKTQSGWITQSSPNGGGQNVLLFEDRKGEEVIRVEAERDLVKLVKRDETVEIKGKRVVNIEQGEQRFTGLDSEAMVVKNSRTLIGLNASRTVGVNDVLMVGGDQRVSVEGAASSEVGATYAVSAGEKVVLACGAASITLEASGKVTVKGTELSFTSTGSVSIDGETISTTGVEVNVSATGVIKIAGGSVYLSGEPVKAN